MLEKVAFFQVADHVRRHSKERQHDRALKLPAIEQLRLVQRHADGIEFRAVFENHGPMRVVGTPIRRRRTIPSGA